MNTFKYWKLRKKAIFVKKLSFICNIGFFFVILYEQLLSNKILIQWKWNWTGIKGLLLYQDSLYLRKIIYHYFLFVLVTCTACCLYLYLIHYISNDLTSNDVKFKYCIKREMFHDWIEIFSLCKWKKKTSLGAILTFFNANNEDQNGNIHQTFINVDNLKENGSNIRRISGIGVWQVVEGFVMKTTILSWL